MLGVPSWNNYCTYYLARTDVVFTATFVLQVELSAAIKCKERLIEIKSTMGLFSWVNVGAYWLAKRRGRNTMASPQPTQVQMEQKGTTVLEEYLTTEGWHIIDKLRTHARKGEYFDYNDLGLSSQTRRFLRSAVPKGIYCIKKRPLRPILTVKMYAYLQGRELVRA